MPVKFQSRHYEAIAEVMKRCKPRQDHETVAEMVKALAGQWDITVSELAALFECDNDNFRAEQFCQACGVPGATWKATRASKNRPNPRPDLPDDWRMRGLR